jgi:hypothetical protein
VMSAGPTSPTPPTPPRPPMVYVEGVCSGRWVRIAISRDVAEADRALYRLLGWAVCDGLDVEAHASATKEPIA